MAVQISFSVSDELHAEVFEVAKEHNMSVNQYARIVFLANRYMDKSLFQRAVGEDLDRRERERRERDEARRTVGRRVKRIDGGGWV